MNKIITILMMSLMTLAWNTANAQQAPTFTFSPATSTAAVGSQISVDFLVFDNFDNIAGLQYAISWDATALQYDGVRNVIGQAMNPNPNIAGYATGHPQGSNLLISTWSHPQLQGQTLPDGSLILTLDFTVLSPGGNDITVNCGNAPELCEFFINDGSGIQAVEGEIFIDEIAEINGGSSAGGAGELILTASTECANTGASVCFDITASDFDQLVGIAHSIHWDETVLQFDSIQAPSPNLLNLSTTGAGSNFGYTFANDGTLVFSWQENNNGVGLSVPDGSLIYRICFKVVGAGGSTSSITFDGDPLAVEVTEQGGMGENVGLIGNAGSFTTKGTGGPIGAIGIEAACLAGDNGDNVCLPISVTDGFDDMVGFQWTMTYDPTIMTFTGLANTNTSLSTLAFNEPTLGTIIFTWNTPQGQGPVTLPDGTTLYEMCFDVIGDAGDIGNLTFTNVPAQIEATAADGDGDGNPDQVAVTNTNGKITVTNSGGFNFLFCDADICEGDAEVCLPVYASGFNMILGMQSSIGYDPAVLTYTSVQNFNSAFATSVWNFNGNTSTPGAIGFIFDSAGAPVTLGDCEIMFELCFSVQGASGTSSTIDITGVPVATEVIQNNPTNPGSPNLIDLFSQPGTISLNCTEGAQSFTCSCVEEVEELDIDDDATTITQIDCPGETNGAIDITVTGGTAPITFSWDNGATTEDINGLGQGTYIVVVTDADNTTATRTYIITEPAAFNSGIVATNETTLGGADGTITLNATGGTSPYTYLWNNGATTSSLTGLMPGTYTCDITDANNCVFTVTGMVGSPIDIGAPSPPGGPAGSTVFTDVLCFGENTGSIDLVFSGGMPPFTFNWDNGATTEDISGLGAGTYCVTITDSNNDTGNACITISQPMAPLSLTDVLTNESVVGSMNGAIDITVAGGTSGYTYAWTGPAGFNTAAEDVSGLSAGFYNVVITDANNCSINMTYEVIAEGDALAVNVNATPVVSADCFGASTGSIDLNVTGGLTPYTFAWSGPGGFTANTQMITGLASGSYTATVTDAANSVAISSAIFVGQPAAPVTISGNPIPESAVGAGDGSINLTVNGGTPGYTYSWSNGMTTANIANLTAGTYTVDVTDSRGCMQSSTFEISANGLSIGNGGLTQVACFEECTGAINLFINGGTAPYTYAWSGPNGYTESTRDINGLCAGSYSCIVTDASGTSLTSQVYVISQPASSMTVSANITAESLPNTIDGAIDITVTGGTPPYSYNWSNSFTSEDISGLTSAPYTVTVSDLNGCQFIETYIVEPAGEPLVIDATNTVVIEPACFGENNGSIDLVVVGGIPGYTYNWDTNDDTEDITNLFAGSYTVTVTDMAGNTATQSFILNQPTQMNLTVDQIINESSNGNDGAIGITVSGGSSPYNYAWTGPNGYTSSSEDQLNLVEGIYTVTVIDANNCVMERVIPLGAILNISDGIVEDVACNGDDSGEIILSVTGGEPPYLYSWSGPNGYTAATRNIRDLLAGTYTVVVTDNIGQMVEMTYTVDEPLNPLTIDPDVLIIKQEGMDGRGMINIEVSGGTLPYNYLWSHGNETEDPNDLEADNYKVTITDANGCILVSPNYTVEYCALPMSLNQTNIEDASCANECDGEAIFQVNGGDFPYELEWSGGDLQTLVTQDPTITLSDLCAGDYTITITDATGQEQTRSFVIDEPLMLIVNGIPTPEVAGMDGTIDITVTGGTTPYSFNWSNGMMIEDPVNLTGGTYSVTVTDANDCQMIAEFTVLLDPLALQCGDASITSVICQEDMSGSIEVPVSGGIAPYTYEWSNGATTSSISGLGVGSYEVTVTDSNGLTASGCGPWSILSQSNLDGIINTMDATCFGCCDGTAEVLPVGNQSPFTFQWSNGATTQLVDGLCAGPIWVTITDALGCEVVIGNDPADPAIIEQPEPMGPLQFVGFTADEGIRCNGDCNGVLRVEAINGLPPYTYQWSIPGEFGSLVAGVCAGEYSVTITDMAGDVIVESFDLVEPDPLSFTFDIVRESAMLTGDGSAEVIVSGGTEPYTYQWNNSTGHTTALCEDLTSATYFVVVIDDNDCTKVDSVFVGIEGVNNVECMSARNIITPDQDGLNDNFVIACALDTNMESNTLEIYNRWGQLVWEGDNYQNDWEGVNQRDADLPPGGYFYVFLVNWDDGSSEQYKGHITILRQ